ncbi:MAG: DUF6516 family protein [Microcystis sp. LE19-338.1B]|nr:DUF6516 family protein [Microcystis sp. LE19-338.1B]MCZ8358803.1 DUF6516 family protein [Microcystis sp. LE19-388.1G]
MIQTFELDTEKRTESLGFIRGNITFIDGSRLYIREFVEVEISIDRGKYSYHYINQKGDLIFRYDNAPHHQKLNFPSFPHHKYDRHEDNIVISKAPFLEEIFQAIEDINNELSL